MELDVHPAGRRLSSPVEGQTSLGSAHSHWCLIQARATSECSGPMASKNLMSFCSKKVLFYFMPHCLAAELLSV